MLGPGGIRQGLFFFCYNGPYMVLVDWGARRKFLYSAVGGFLLFIILVVLWATFFTRTPTCFDAIQNGGEAGVDCGGSCALICADAAHAPVVLWARAFESSSTTYTAAAYVQNNNVGAGARRVGYSFQLLDADNQLVIDRVGTIDLPPVVTIPIIETNIDVGYGEVARTLFAFSDVPVWHKISAEQFPELRVTAQELSSDASRLSVRVTNTAFDAIGRLAVTAVLFDSDNVARAASQSIIESIARQSSQDVVFTWPGGVPDIVRAEITVLPSF